MSPSDTPLAPGVVLADRYELQRRLGQGAMGAVFLAWDRVLERPVAIKELLPHLVDDAALAERAMREALLLARLRHPAIVVVHDRLTTPEGAVRLVLEHVDGPSLDRLLASEGRLPWPRCAEIGIAVCGALEAAHAEGIIHRDIKPGNILIDAHGRVKVADFGIARLAGSGAASLGTTIGTPAYMAPEQTRGRAQEASDIYSLCCVLFEAATGRRPFAADDGTPVQMLHLLEPVPDPHDVAPDLPPAARDLIMAGLAKAPEDRPPSAAALAALLRGSLRAAAAETVAHPAPTQPAATVPAAGPSGTVPASTAPARAAIPTAAAPAVAPTAPAATVAAPPRPPWETDPGAAAPRRRRRGALAAAAVVAAIAAGAVAGMAAAPSEEPAAPPPVVVGAGAVAAGPVGLTVPGDWRSEPGDTTGMGLSEAVTAAPPAAAGGTAIVAGTSDAQGPRLLPASVRAGAGERVRLGATEALRYRGARVAGAPATVHVVPTTGGVATVACLGAAADGGRLAGTCDAAAASLRLTGVDAFPAGPDARYAARLRAALARTDAALASLAGLSGDRTARAQEARVRRAARAVAAARRGLPGPAAVSPAVRPAHRALLAALAAEASALSRMARAAAADRAAGWAAGRRAAARARTRLDAALRALDAAGYRRAPGR